MIPGMQQRDIFDLSLRDENAYVITIQELAVKVTF